MSIMYSYFYIYVYTHRCMCIYRLQNVMQLSGCFAHDDGCGRLLYYTHLSKLMFISSFVVSEKGLHLSLPACFSLSLSLPLPPSPSPPSSTPCSNDHVQFFCLQVVEHHVRLKHVSSSDDDILSLRRILMSWMQVSRASSLACTGTRCTYFFHTHVYIHMY